MSKARPSIDERLTFDATSETTPIVLGLSFAIIIVLILKNKKKCFCDFVLQFFCSRDQKARRPQRLKNGRVREL